MEFYWNTQREVSVEDRTVILSGRRGRIVLQVPDGCTVRVDDLPLYDAPALATPQKDVQRRIAVGMEATSGVLEIHAQLLCT